MNWGKKTTSSKVQNYRGLNKAQTSETKIKPYCYLWQCHSVNKTGQLETQFNVIEFDNIQWREFLQESQPEMPCLTHFLHVQN